MDVKVESPNITKARIGIIAGSGPEAGLDLWDKLLKANRAILGTDFHGDLDAPNVTVFSEPSLGLAINLEANCHLLWQSLRPLAEQISVRVDYYSIACNSLNYFQPQLDSLGLNAKLISFADSAVELINRENIRRVALLGTPSVMKLGNWSHYRILNQHVEVEALSSSQEQQLHQVIEGVKVTGANDPRITESFAALLGSIRCGTIILACTELPLIHVKSDVKRLVDVTQLVAARLARLSSGLEPG